MKEIKKEEKPEWAKISAMNLLCEWAQVVNMASSEKLYFPLYWLWWQGAMASDTVGYICIIAGREKSPQGDLKSTDSQVSILILNSVT